MTEIDPAIFALLPIAALATGAAWFASLVRWRSGLKLLILFLPFAGIVTLALRPSSLGVLAKDVAFVLPLYLSLFVIHGRARSEATIPQPVTIALFVFAVIVFAQWLNPSIAGFAVAAIGTFVWLFYMPMAYVAAAAVATREDLVGLLRLMLISAAFPLGFGILQYFMCATLGYQRTMSLFYGQYAYDVTQGFTTFDFGGTLYRIPSTFSFVTQYFGFTLAMMVPAYALTRLETEPRWRRFARIMLILAIVASTLSGARAAFVFVPLLLGLMLVLDGRFSGVFAGIVLLPGIMFLALDAANLDPIKILGGTRDLAKHYSEDLIVEVIANALIDTPFGTGTGMNTGAARHGADANRILYESLYAKSIVELGVFGLVALLAVFGGIALLGLDELRRARDPGIKSALAAFLAFHLVMVVNSLKGWQIDLDPVNVLFWVFAGLMFKARRLERTASPNLAERTAAPVGAGWQPPGRRIKTR